MTIKQLIKQIEKRMAGVAKERDKLDDLIMECGMLKENCETALDDLDRARDALSELV